jgi:carbamoyl-phosphate synthase large subunit
MSDGIRVAVTGAGGGVGQSIIKALAGSEYEVVALDGETLGTGLYAARKAYRIPYARDPAFAARVAEICRQEGCRLLFPGLDAELPIFAREVERFAGVGTRVVVSTPDVVEVCDNKLLTFTRLRAAGIPVPETVDLAAFDAGRTRLPPFPFILKKREGGARSKDVHRIDHQAGFDAFRAGGGDLSRFVAQEYIEGDEFTCGSVNLDGECMGVIVMRRILRDGDTYKCFSLRDERIEATVHAVVAAVKPFGACNVQLRTRDGQPFVFELNARCSGTTAARALCGFNEPRSIADYLIHGARPSYSVTEQTILRYWKELVVPKGLVDDMAARGTIAQDGFTRL